MKGARFLRRVKRAGPLSATVLASSKPPKKAKRPIKLVEPLRSHNPTHIEFVVPVRILSKNQTAGGAENGFARAKRRANEHAHTRYVIGAWSNPFGFPVDVTIYRMAPRMLDDDNPDCKAIRDEIAAWLGVNDRDRTKARFIVDQEKSAEYGVRIRIEPRRAA